MSYSQMKREIFARHAAVGRVALVLLVGLSQACSGYPSQAEASPRDDEEQALGAGSDDELDGDAVEVVPAEAVEVVGTASEALELPPELVDTEDGFEEADLDPADVVPKGVDSL